MKCDKIDWSADTERFVLSMSEVVTNSVLCGS